MISGGTDFHSSQLERPLNRVIMLPAILLAFSTVVRASPPPPLPWTTSRFTVTLESGAVEFTMECPGGKLTRLSAARAQQVAHLAMERLAELSLSKTCSGVSTRKMLEDEGSRQVTGVELKVLFSHEYVVEELWISFDLQSFEFTDAMRVFTLPEESSQITRVKLR